MTTYPHPRTAQYTATSHRVVNQAGKIVLDANAEIKAGTFTFEKWAKSASQLTELALNTGLEMVPPSFPYACYPTATEASALSDWINVDIDKSNERALSMSTPFVKLGEPSCVIPNEFVSFSAAILARGDGKFRINVTWPELRSGTYKGEIRLTPLTNNNPKPVELGVTVDL